MPVSSNGYPGHHPGRKRCPLPEINNPVLQPRNTGGNGDIRSLLAITLLFFMLLFGYQYVHKSTPSTPTAASLVQSQKLQTEIFKAPILTTGDHSITQPSSFGWLAFIAKPLYLALRFLHGHGIGNWGWAIIVFTVMFNMLTLWPRLMSMKSSLKMMRIQPKVDALKKRYAHLTINDPKRTEMNAEMMTLYKAEGANIFGGCLPLLLQMPLLFAYMSVLRNAAELHQAHWLWLTDLSSPDPLHILPFLIIASMILTQFITPSPTMTPSQRWMLGILMPAVMGFSLWRYASGLSLYWITGNLINLLIQLAINRSKMGKEMRALAAERAMIAPNSNKELRMETSSEGDLSVKANPFIIQKLGGHTRLSIDKP
jgi:YidC/Oxa1 family membrane protein insertase